MTDFLSKLFSTQKTVDNNLGGASLMQGARFNKMQSAIENPVYSHLALMEQTTGAGLGSIKEPLENNSQLPSLDNKELKVLSKMERKYEALIKELQTAQRHSHAQKMNSPKFKELQSKIKKLNSQIMRQANILVKQTYSTNNTNTQLNKYRGVQRSDLKQKLDMIMKRKQSYDGLIGQTNSLVGQQEDRQNELDAAYLHYIVWFIAATTLGVLTVHQLSK
jgi:chromosome segregation ATPase